MMDHAAPALDNEPQELEELKLEQILQHLSTEELEVAARASYLYFRNPNPAETETYAKHYARRFLQAKDGDVDKALVRLQDTLRFRTSIGVDQLRSAFDKENDNNTAADEDENENNPATENENNAATTQARLEKEIRSQCLFVQGYDREGHSTYVFIPRKVVSHDSKEWIIKQHVYALERASAASRATDGTVNAVVDFKGFSFQQHAPPLDIGQEFLSTLRNHYVGRIHKIFILDAPTAFSYLWAMFQPFVGTKTREKIEFVQSSNSDLSRYYEKDEVPSWMMEGGQKNRELDVDEYLFQTPFDRSFGQSYDEDSR